MRPFMVNFEGLDCSGKSTQAARLAKTYRDAGFKVHEQGFPDHESFFGKLIREHLARKWKACGIDDQGVRAYDTADAATFQALQIANRLDIVPDEAWEEEPRSGSTRSICVFDRLHLSGIVYGHADGLDLDLMVRVHRHLPQPNICFVMDLPPEEALVRLAERKNEEPDRYESEGLKRFSRMRVAYLDVIALLQNEPGHRTHYEIVDARPPVDEVAEHTLELTQRIFRFQKP